MNTITKAVESTNRFVGKHPIITGVAIIYITGLAASFSYNGGIKDSDTIREKKNNIAKTLKELDEASTKFYGAKEFYEMFDAEENYFDEKNYKIFRKVKDEYIAKTNQEEQLLVDKLDSLNTDYKAFIDKRNDELPGKIFRSWYGVFE